MERESTTQRAFSHSGNCVATSGKHNKNFLSREWLKGKYLKTFSIFCLWIIGSSVMAQTTSVWSGASGGAWLTAGNWTPSGAPNASTIIASFGNTNTATTVGLNTNTQASTSLAAITFLTGTSTANLALGNSGTAGSGGTITFAGTTINSVANTVLRSTSAKNFTYQDNVGSGSKTLGFVLGNATDNVVNIDGAGLVTISSIISGASKNLSLNCSSTGYLIFTSAANSYSGTTTINSSSELRLNPSATTATFASQVKMNGGTLSSTGIAASTTWTNSSTLNFNANSTIALGTNAHSLKFANSSGVTWAGTTLTVTGWTGTPGSSGTAGKLFIGTDATGVTAGQLAQIFFLGSTNGTTILSTGEVVPAAPPTPTLNTPNPTSLSGFTYVFGSGPSAQQSFTVGGSNLTNNLIVTPSTNYQLSTTNGSGYSSSAINLGSGNVASTTIYAILASGLAVNTYNETINITSTGATNTPQTVTLNGSVTAPAPILTPSVGTLTGFTYLTGSGPSTSQSFTFTGAFLTGATANITVTGSTDYEVSTDNSTFAASVTYQYTSATLTSQTVYVRLMSGRTAGNYNSQNIAISGGGATTVNVVASGSVTNPSELYLTAINSATVESFDGLGSGLTSIPAGFKIGQTTDWSTSGTTLNFAYGSTGTGVVTSSSSGGNVNWANGITASATDRALGSLTTGSATSPRTILVALKNTTGSVINQLDISFDYEKYRSGSRQHDYTFFHGSTTSPSTAATAGNHTFAADANNLVINNPPTTTSKSVTLSGLSIANNGLYYLMWTLTGLAGSTNGQGLGLDNLSIIPSNASSPSLTLGSSALTGFNYEFSTGPSTSQSFTLNATNLTADAVVTGSTNYEVSTDNSNFFASVNVTPGGGTISAVPVYVRLKGGLAVANYNSEVINVTSTGAVPRSLTASGLVLPHIPIITLAVSTNSASETSPATIVTVTANASFATLADETVSLAVTGTGITAADYALSNTTITILTGQTSGTVTFTINDDNTQEATETAVLTISSPSAGVALGVTTVQNVVITDNDDAIYLTGTVNVTSAPVIDFNDLITSGTASLTVKGAYLYETGSSANTTYAAFAEGGTSTAGNTYSFGTGVTTERALGSVASGGVGPTHFGLKVTNNTGGNINAFDIAYTGEQWHSGGNPSTDILYFEYSTNATSLSTGTFNNITALNVVSPINGGSAIALDGNLPANKVSLSGTIGLGTIANGSSFWIRWRDENIGGSDDGMGVDDITLTPRFITPTSFYTKSTGNLDDLATWGDNPDGSGNPPPDFSTGGQTFYITQAVATLGANWTVSGSTSKVVVGNGVAASTFTAPSSFTFNGAIDVSANATLELLSAGSVATFGTINSASTITYGSTTGSQDISPTTYGNLTLSGAGIKNIKGATTVTGNIVLDGATLDMTTLPSFTNILFAGNITVNSACTYNSGFTGFVSFKTTGNAAQTIFGNGNTLSCSQFVCLDKTSGSVTLSIAGGTTTLITQDDIRMNMPTGVTFTDNGNSISVGGDFETDGVTASYLLTGTLTMTGHPTGAVNIRVAANIGAVGVAEINNLVIASTTSNQVNIQPITGTAATINIKGSLTIAGTSGYASGIRFGGATTANTINVKGDYTNTLSSSVIINGISTVVFNGTGAQTISTANSSGEPFYNMTINNSAGVSLSSGDVSVSNSLTCTSGVLNTSSNKVNLQSTASITETTASRVLGNVQTSRSLSTAPESFGGIGLTVTANNASPGNTVVLRNTGTSNPIGCVVGSIKRTFTITPVTDSNLDATIDLTFVPVNELNGLNQSNLKLFNVGTATAVTGSSITGNVISASGMSSIGGSYTGAINNPILVINTPNPACTPSTVNLTANAVTTGSEGGTKAYWEDVDMLLPLSSPGAVATSGTYYISLTNASGCTSIQPVVVVVNTTPSAPSVSTPVTYCQGASPADLALSVTGSLLTWYTVPTGGLGSSSSPTLSTSSAGNSNYYVSQTSAQGCTSSRSNIVVHVDANPNTPSATSHTQCSAGVSLANVSTNASGLQSVHLFDWYDAASGGTLLQSDLSDSYIPSVSSTTDFYVSERSDANPSCSSARVLVTARVLTNSETVSTSGINPACANTAFTVSLANPVTTGDVTYQWYYQLASGYPSTWLLPSTPVFSSNVSTGANLGVNNQSFATYYYAQVNCNAGGNISTSPYVINEKSAFTCSYCQPAGGSCGGASKTIAGVKLKSNALNQYLIINDPNGCSVGGFGTFSGNSNDGITPMATLYKTYSYTLEVTPASIGTYITVWLDANVNGSFTNVGENVLVSSPVGGPTGNFTFTVPSNFVNIGTTVLRIRSSAAPITDACLSSVGETEDYVISIANVPTPLNDNVYSPSPLPNLAVNNVVSYTAGTNVNATNSANIAGSCFGANANYKDVWFQCTVPTSGVVYLNVVAGTLADHDMQVWTSSNGQSDGVFTSLGCDDNSGTGSEPFMKVTTTPGVKLFIQVKSHVATASGTFSIAATNGVNWKGTVSTDWSNSANWYNDNVPSSTDDIVLPTVTNQPALSSSTSVNTIYIQKNTVVSINTGAELNFLGNMEVIGTTGTYGRFRGLGTLTTDANNSINGNVVVENFSKKGAGTTTTVNASTGTLSIVGVYSSVAGTLVTNNKFIIRSYESGTGSAYLGTGQIATGGAGIFSGDVSIEHKIAASSYPMSHYVSSPITEPNTVAQNYGDDYGVVGSPYPWQFIGTNAPTVWPSSFWYDAVSPAPSSTYRWWNAIGKEMTPGLGISVNTPGGVTLDAIGTPQNANVISVPVTALSWNLVGNPYPSAIDLNLFLPSNVANIYGHTIYYNHYGSSVSYSDIAGASPIVNGYERYMSHTTGFWAYAGGAGSDIKFSNSHRVTTQGLYSSSGTFWGSEEPTTKATLLRLQIKDAANLSRLDETVIGKTELAQDGMDDVDGLKMMMNSNTQPYIYTSIEGENVVFNLMNNTEGKEIPVGVVTTAAGNWVLAVENSDAFVSEATSLFLEDRSTSPSTYYNLKSTPSVTFNLPEGNIGSRFYLHIGDTKATNVKSVSAKAGVAIYSNSNKLYVNFGTELKGATSLEVYSLSGQRIVSLDATSYSGLREINMNHASAGNYLVKITNGNSIYTEKVFINK